MQAAYRSTALLASIKRFAADVRHSSPFIILYDLPESSVSIRISDWTLHRSLQPLDLSVSVDRQEYP